MCTSKQITHSTFLINCILFSCLCHTAHARSVYVITDGYSTVKAYNIQDGQIVEQATAENLANHGGAVGLALDPDSELMFVTYEGSNIIEMVNAKTMISEENPVTVDGVSSLAGIAFDQSKQKLYVVQREYYKLFVYLWNPIDKTLILEGGTYKILADLPSPYAYGIALDENMERLYVSNATSTVHYYDTNSWNHVNSVDVNRVAVGITVDQQTSLVLITTYESGLNPDRLIIYDSNLVKQPWESGDIGNPAGICVPSGEVSYKPPDFYLVKDNNDPNDECVRPLISEVEHEWLGVPYNYLTFDVCYDANDHADSNVVLIDYLPKECDYYSSTPDGNYNSADHTVTWNLGNIGGDDANCFQVVTAVNYWARPGGVITNLVVMEGDTYLNEATCDVNVCPYGTEIIYVDKDANDPNSYNNGTSWFDAYTDLQDGLTGARNCGASVTAIWVAAGTYKPVNDVNVTDYRYESFELPNDVGLFGHFGGVGTYETSPDQRNFADVNNTTTLDGQIGENYYEAVKYIVKAEDIQDAIVDGFTIRGSYIGAGIYLDDANVVAIVNCKLKENVYSGIEVTNFSYLDIHNCLFMNNSSYSYGINCNYSWLAITDSIFDGNNITQRAITANRSDIELTDCIVKNHTGNSIYVTNTIIDIEGCCIKNNDYCIYCSDSNTAISHSLIERNPGTGIYCLSYST